MKSKTIAVLSTLLSHGINKRQSIRKCKSLKTVYLEKSNAGYLLVGLTVSLSKMILRRM